jgi:hypothetical protein
LGFFLKNKKKQSTHKKLHQCFFPPPSIIIFSFAHQHCRARKFFFSCNMISSMETYDDRGKISRNEEKTHLPETVAYLLSAMVGEDAFLEQFVYQELEYVLSRVCKKWRETIRNKIRPLSRDRRYGYAYKGGFVRELDQRLMFAEDLRVGHRYRRDNDKNDRLKAILSVFKLSFIRRSSLNLALDNFEEVTRMLKLVNCKDVSHPLAGQDQSSVVLSVDIDREYDNMLQSVEIETKCSLTCKVTEFTENATSYYQRCIVDDEARVLPFTTPSSSSPALSLSPAPSPSPSFTYFSSSHSLSSSSSSSSSPSSQFLANAMVTLIKAYSIQQINCKGGKDCEFLILEMLYLMISKTWLSELRPLDKLWAIIYDRFDRDLLLILYSSIRNKTWEGLHPDANLRKTRFDRPIISYEAKAYVAWKRFFSNLESSLFDKICVNRTDLYSFKKIVKKSFEKERMEMKNNNKNTKNDNFERKRGSFCTVQSSMYETKK